MTRFNLLNLINENEPTQNFLNCFVEAELKDIDLNNLQRYILDIKSQNISLTKEIQ